MSCRVTWPQFVDTMIDAGCQSNDVRLAFFYSRKVKDIDSIDPPTTPNDTALNLIATKLTKLFGWHAERFVL